MGGNSRCLLFISSVSIRSNEAAHINEEHEGFTDRLESVTVIQETDVIMFTEVLGRHKYEWSAGPGQIHPLQKLQGAGLQLL